MFEGSRVKLQRADKFIRELHEWLSVYNATNHTRAKVVWRNSQPEIAIEWTPMGLVPGAILGDAIHNLRAALDLMAAELVRLMSKSDDRVHFPFSKSDATFEETIRSTRFIDAGEDAVRLVRTFTPFSGGNDRLRAIHDLDIQDKHRALLDTERTVDATYRARINRVDPNDTDAEVIVRSIKHGFWKETPLAGLPLIETMGELCVLVHGIVDAFEELVAARNP